ncbi:MAG: symmetrical bis(5'-nucleosyl)-tetraphosphatase [Saprospiraceae bacterium]|nr:symmetrical bis(5'-nucleosyl)-tetraphosphatase [Saprospiraceae bacterium]
MTTYAVGDIQGCFDSLVALLELVDFSASRDTLWVAGDLINRGPKNLETLLFLENLGDSCKIVLGNHDLHFLATQSGLYKRKPKDTFHDILDSQHSAFLADWLKQQPLVYFDEHLNYLMVHAGIPPQWSRKQALKRAKEVSQALRTAALSFYSAMYGNTPEKWQSTLTGNTRLRMITNYFTRMRFCTSKGKLELKTKTASDDAPKGFAPWFDHKNHKCRKENILFGHWAALLGKTGHPHFIALDTGCVWGNKLTLFNLQSREKHQVDCEDCIN